jgi:hypothetical protein
LETNQTIRPGENIDLFAVCYPLARVKEMGIYCKLLMDNESPAQSGVTVAIDEVTPSEWKEKLGD